MRKSQPHHSPQHPHPQFTQLSKLNYSSLSSLQSVIKDESSLSTYAQYIKNNGNIFHDKIILHLASDCNCIYSILAAQAGAKIVYCVLHGHGVNQERNKYMIEEIVKENEYEGIVCVKLFKDFKIQGKVDVIIGEPMGCNLFYDGMMDRMIQARDLYLNKQTGVMIPDKIRFKCALIWDEYQKDEKLQYWDEVYGVSMKEMKKWVQQQPCIRVVDPTLIISEVSQLFQLNMYQTSYQQIDEIHKKISLKPLNSECLKANGLVIWFEVDFISADGQVTMIDASPWCEETRWSHLTLYTKDIWELAAGQAKKIELMAKKSYIVGNVSVKLKINGKEEVYTLW